MATYTVFGYGSLIFKPPPHVVRQTPGFLKGYVRRFAQSSCDHRGTPQYLGRVVTLISADDWAHFSSADPYPDEDVVWGNPLTPHTSHYSSTDPRIQTGIAYTIDPAYAVEVRDYLDYREKNGYTIQRTDVYGYRNGIEVVVEKDATIYVGKRDNPAFVGSEDLDILAARIHTSVGPSGRNKDYLYDLVDAVKGLASESHDSHLAALESRVRALDDQE